jgi:DNA mismatch repair protein MutS
MVEMTEAAAILNDASPSSLVLMDEIGRGTSTFDGLALAWAIARHLLSHNHCFTLFATHYFELTQLPDDFPQAANVHLSAVEHGKGIVFLHSVDEGPASQSYGLQVAQLAGVPSAVIRAARKHLAHLERNAVAHPTPQLDLFVTAGTRDADEDKDDLCDDDSAAHYAMDEPEPLQAREPDPQAAHHAALAERLAQVDPDELRPKEALDLLYELRALLDNRT